jgi:hypothetical protein
VQLRDIRFSTRSGVVLGVVALIALTLYLIPRALPRITSEKVQDVVFTTIQREAPASFYVTGFIDVVAGTTVTNTNVLLPGLLDLSMGKTTATVRVPGRLSYGFNVAGLKRDNIRVRDDSIIEVTLPQLSLYSTEPNLSQLEIQTSRGWLRTEATQKKVTTRALDLLQTALRRQGEQHLRQSVQPRVNTAAALEKLLTPALRAAGINRPRFRFTIGEGVVVEPERRAR